MSIDNVGLTDLKKIKKFGFKEIKIKAKTEEARFEGISTLILHKSGKLQIQGKKAMVEETLKMLDYVNIGKKTKISGVAVGTDESLKGDTFGGIIVAGFLADDDIRSELKKIGVKDSKTLTKPEISSMAQELIAKFPDNYHVENIFPKEYNKLNMVMDVTEILNKLHERCYKKLSRNALHIIDLYPGCSVGDIKETKADSKYLEVSAASVLARYFALMQIRELEHRSGFFIPMGSTSVESGMLEIKKKSLNPADYVKMKFRNVVDFF
jgi:ribonuclease HIII